LFKVIKLKNIFALALLIIIIFVLLDVVKIQNIIQENLYPRKYEEIVSKYSKEYDVEEELIYAIIKAESNFKTNAVSNKEAMGLMQLVYSTAEEVAQKIDISIEKEQLLEPEINIMLGTKYISILITKYNCVPVALAAYNAGSGNVDKWIEEGTIQSDGSDIENVPYTETNNYVRKILRDYKIYKM
jgi:soluble lytic murein transglycosylase